jgi:predicted nucleic acid-binding protein
VTFIDTNVLIDVFDADPEWENWSAGRLEEQTAERDGVVNPVVIAELSCGFESLSQLLDLLTAASIEVVPLEEEAAFLAGARFASYRKERRQSEPRRVLADFLIGAHAHMLGVPLLTRDAALYRRYFPDLALITPDSHP